MARSTLTAIQYAYTLDLPMLEFSFSICKNEFLSNGMRNCLVQGMKVIPSPHEFLPNFPLDELDSSMLQKLE